MGNVRYTRWWVLDLHDFGLGVSLDPVVRQVESKLQLALLISLSLSHCVSTLRLQIPFEVPTASMSKLVLALRFLLFRRLQMLFLSFTLSLLFLLCLDSVLILLSFRNDCL